VTTRRRETENLNFKNLAEPVGSVVDSLYPVPGDEHVGPLRGLQRAVSVGPRAEARDGLGEPSHPTVDHLAIPGVER